MKRVQTTTVPIKSVQMFTKSYLERCKKIPPAQILRFLDDFRLMHFKAASQKSRLISIKIPAALLQSFKLKSQLKGVKYQTQIKELMRDWLKE